MTNSDVRPGGAETRRFRVRPMVRIADLPRNLPFRERFALAMRAGAEGRAVSDALADVGFDGWGTCAKLSSALPSRLASKASRVLSRRDLDGLPALGPGLTRLQAALTRRALSDAVARVDRYLR